jgi:hypothetical protein
MTTITLDRPIEGPAYDKAKPETRQPWLDFRRPGITATMIRDWGNGSRRRKIIEEKITGEFEDLSNLPYVAHGNVREPVIADWVHGKYGIKPCDSVYAHPDNPRHLASPDGVSVDPFTGELLVATEDAVLLEIKTSKHDLHPGTLSMLRVLETIEEGSHFDRSNYYTQMQWQMYVMNSPMTLFVWEQHDNVIDPETNTFTPIGPPQVAFVPRNQALIDVLVEKVAPKALAEIDAAVGALRTTDLPPASDFPTEHAVWVQDVLTARDQAANAEAARVKSWDSLSAVYMDPEADDCKHDLGFATLSVSTSTSPDKTVEETKTDWDAVRAGLTDAQRKKYDALVEKHTTTQPKVIPGKTSRRMTITAKEVKP